MELPNVELEFAEPKSADQANSDSGIKIISTQIQRLKIRLERAKSAYENGIDTLGEYKENKKAILDGISKLKEQLKRIEEKPKEQIRTNIKELRRLTEVLRDAEVDNTEKNKMARRIFKEIVKDSNTLKCVFWR